MHQKNSKGKPRELVAKLETVNKQSLSEIYKPETDKEKKDFALMVEEILFGKLSDKIFRKDVVFHEACDFIGKILKEYELLRDFDQSTSYFIGSFIKHINSQHNAFVQEFQKKEKIIKRLTNLLGE